MPGIFGLINLDKNLIDDKTTLEMANLLQHEEWQISDWVINSCLLGVVELNTIKCKNIIKDKNSELLGVSRGQIFNKDQLAKKYDIKHNGNFLNDIQFITQLYEKIGPNFAKYMKGIFNIALYDIKDDKIIVVNDRYGYYPLFYSLNDERFTFASEAKAVLAGSKITPKIDKNAVPEFLSFKFPLDEKTFFEQVKHLQPATILIYDGPKQNLIKQRYWNYIPKLPKKHEIKDINNLIRSYKKLMEKAVERTIQDKKEIGIFLSGGLDSTIITAFASQTNADVITFTFGHKNCSLEKQTAKSIADELGVENVFYEIPSDFITNFANKIVYQGDGLIRIRESHFVACLEDIRKKIDTVLIGTMGDLTHINIYNFYMSPIKARLKGIKGIKESFFFGRTKQLPLDKYSEVFNKKFCIEAKKAVKIDFNRDFNRIMGKNQINQYEMLKTWWFEIGFSKGLAQQFQYMDWYLETRHPFLDNDVFNFTINLPLQVLQGNRFLKKVMKYCFPKLCKIQLEHGYSFNANPLEFCLGLLKLSILNRARARKTSINHLDYRDYGNMIRIETRDFVIDILNNSHTLNKYFKKDFIEKLLNDHMSLKEDNNTLICDLINLELIHREFNPSA